MSAHDVKQGISALDGKLRERIVFKLIVLAGMRVSEVFGLRRGRVFTDYVDITERVCRRDVDKPKTPKSERQAALSSLVQEDLALWLATSPDTGPEGWLFPSETLKSPMGSDNFMARYLRPLLKSHRG
jgi:integrase